MRTIISWIFLVLGVCTFGQDNIVYSQFKDQRIPDTVYIPGKKVYSKYVDDTSWIENKFLPDLLVSNNGNKLVHQSGLSMRSEGKYKTHWNYVFYSRLGIANQGPIAYTSLPQTKSFFYHSLSNNQSEAIYADIRGAIFYKPNQYLRFDVGMGRNKLGGEEQLFNERSLFSGDQGISNPYASMDIKFGKFNYTLLQQVWREKLGSAFTPKGNSTHYLSYKATDKWYLGLFESVVYQMKDTLYNRGYEVEYLNPLLFYRPQEYNIGSADNILLGLETQYKFKKGALYGQLLIDDFLLSAYKSHNRWWANKFGVQLGIRGWKWDYNEESMLKGFEYQTELNIMRPYTFSQVNPSVVYGNQGLPIAHPLGSNFIELYQKIYFSFKSNLYINSWVQGYVKGTDFTDLPNKSFGGDIYISYKYVDHEFNNTIGQGKTMQVLSIASQIGKSVETKQGALRCFIEPKIRITNIENHTLTNIYVTFGIQSSFWSYIDRRNY